LHREMSTIAPKLIDPNSVGRTNKHDDIIPVL
jgi:hypothetical protein